MKTLSILVFILLSLQISAQADLDRGLIAYYPFDSSGVNKSPNRLLRTDFEMHNVSYNYGFEGKTPGSIAPHFYGSDSYGRLAEGLQSEAFSLSLWFNTDTRDKTSTLLAWDQKAYRMELLPGGKLHCNLSVTNNYFYDYIHESRDLADGKWHHVVMSLDKDVFSIYLDGEMVPGIAKKYNNVSVYYEGGGLQIGGLASAQNKNYFTGRMDELYLYNRGLSADEVKILAGKARIDPDPDLETGLVLYLPFDDDDNNHSPNHYKSSQINVYGGSLVENCVLNSPFKRMKLFNGLDQYLSGSNALALPVFSLSFSFQSTSAKESFVLGWDSAGYQVVLNPKGSVGKLAIKLWQSPTQVYTFISPLRLNDGDCHQVALSFDGKQLLIFIDGALADDKGKFKTEQPVYYAGASSFMIGNDSKEGKGRGFQGKMDELRLYNRAINLAEVAELKNPKPVSAPCVIRYYESKGTGSKLTFTAINCTEAKKISFKDNNTKKDIAQVKVKPGEPIPLLSFPMSKGQFTPRIE
ncbi:MAG: LamG domain-containing protein [Haliscomenobacter sp.]|uniref:LamG domain-containing protein n=1 Tax=Haliscomenobacter sp. TaxID=2717303 RepID=UPI0029B855D2|nr:LamG domain-containing protein [Haliscomenobacter sp.]MDX2070965.1 LamG domain-containing protein [Haliscomenobacter sp.]